MLKRLHHMHWFDAHYMALHAVTRMHGKNFFKRCEVPGCHNFEDENVRNRQKKVFKIIILLGIFLLQQQMQQNYNFIALMIL